jgi:glycosyltransferase involved in cell wall biosynthesis
MRVLHVSQRYLPAIGGAERHAADISEELVRRGHEVDVFASRALDFYSWKDELPAHEQINGVNVYRFRSMRRGKKVWQMLQFGQYHYWRTRARRYEPFIFLGGGPISPGMFWTILRRGRTYDLIHLSTLVYSHVTYGCWAARRLHVPVVITPHCHAEQEVSYNVGYQRWAMQQADHVIADTRAERDLLLDLGLDPWRVSVAGLGLCVEDYERAANWNRTDARRRLGLPEEGFVTLFLGRKTAYKGLDVTLEAYGLLQERYPHIHLLAVGPETDYSQTLWPRYRDRTNVHVHGSVSDDEKLAALVACDCLALPSSGEAFGIVFLEAWLLGRPVLGNRTPVAESIIDHGRDGFLVAPGDTVDLAASIERLIQVPGLVREMGARGREKVVSRYTTPRITDRVEGVYLRVLRSRRRDEQSFRNAPA